MIKIYLELFPIGPNANTHPKLKSNRFEIWWNPRGKRCQTKLRKGWKAFSRRGTFELGCLQFLGHFSTSLCPRGKNLNFGLSCSLGLWLNKHPPHKRLLCCLEPRSDMGLFKLFETVNTLESFLKLTGNSQRLLFDEPTAENNWQK